MGLDRVHLRKLLKLFMMKESLRSTATRIGLVSTTFGFTLFPRIKSGASPSARLIASQ